MNVIKLKKHAQPYHQQQTTMHIQTIKELKTVKKKLCVNFIHVPKALYNAAYQTCGLQVLQH